MKRLKKTVPWNEADDENLCLHNFLGSISATRSSAVCGLPSRTAASYWAKQFLRLAALILSSRVLMEIVLALFQPTLYILSFQKM